MAIMQRANSQNSLGSSSSPYTAFASNNLETLLKQGPQEKPSQLKAVEDGFMRLDPKSRFVAADTLIGQRSTVINDMMALLNSTNDNVAKFEIASVLGEYRATEAVPFLVNHLELDDVPRMLPGMMYRSVSLADAMDNPLSGALIKIGMPAVSPLMERIAKTDDTNVIGKCVRICYRIEGREVAQFRLEGLLAKESESKSRVRLQAALDALKALK
jgi:hypothetical protein